LRTIREHKRFNVLDCGRRFGKTVEGKDLAVEMMLAGYPVGWFAPEYKYLLEVWNELKFQLGSVISRSNETERRIELVTGGHIEMWSLERGNAGRSRKYARVIVDEAAMVPGLMKKWGEDIRPTLTDLKGDAWFMSTPKGRNDFYQLWLRGQDPLDADWMSWQMPTTANPFIDPEEIESARKDMLERTFAQEHLAEFLEDSAVFRKIKEAATAQPQRYTNDGFDPEPRHGYVVGVDWGKYEDYSVFSVIDANTKELCYLDRSNRVDYLIQLERIKDICRRFNILEIIAEGNAQTTTIELLRGTGLPVREFTTTNASKQYIIEQLMLGLEQSTLKILPDPVLLGELQSFEATKTPSGAIRYAAPEGYHDDCVMSLALAWDGCKGSVASVRVGTKKKTWRRDRR
jgi:hypothetical protein